MTIANNIAAGIDLGSNTFRLLIADYSKGNIQILVKKLASVRLGRGLEKNRTLQKQAMDKGFEVLNLFRQDLDHYQPKSMRICGTEALRRASNSPEFIHKAKEILQSDIDIISGEEEAHLSLSGALSGCGDFSGNILLIDVGGGSTEIILSDTTNGETRTESIDLGVVCLTEKFLTPPAYQIAAMDALLTEKIGSSLENLRLGKENPALCILGCGGTATSLAALALNLTSYDASLVHGHILHDYGLQQLWKRLVEFSAEERNELPCLGEGRGEILPAGLRIYMTLLKLLGQDRVRVSDTGLLEGILLSATPVFFKKLRFSENFNHKT
ncbi:MAG: Ppx/GppA family phosphatase [Deltaproteobacteria bacterium]|jgi:exopolyphosphatase/guanosine-5'-triphosphate,3'-diphosphate pyrophosphatase|nr:Ppx/GppA family phosphatase [Deltaproteobacteria bacterium]